MRRPLASCCRIRSASVLVPRTASQQSNGPGTAPTAFCTKPIRSARSSRFATSIPPTMSLCPFRYLVVECSTTSAPSSSGRWKHGVAKVLSTTNRAPARRAISPAAARSHRRIIGSAAHEYFHVWNVKRVRPAALGPFDYTREQYEPSLWVAEGWTQYYGEVTLFRAGIEDTAAFYRDMSVLIHENLTAPGRKEVSARMSSFNAPFWDGPPQAQPTNFQNTFFDYYTRGAGLALYLDLFIRNRTNNTKSLDDAFNNLKQRVWNAPTASYYLQGRGYTEDDVERAVSDAAGIDMHDWFERHVGGTEDMDYDEALGWAGLKLVRSGDRWSIEVMPDATPQQLRVRVGWLSGLAR